MSKRHTRSLGLLILLVVLVAVVAVLALPRARQSAQAGLVGLAGDAGAFARAEGPRSFNFPADHGAHPDYQTEWWYYTGNLTTENGRHFGYQLTFFRRALQAAPERAVRTSPWAVEQVYMAHFAITDVDGAKITAREKLARGAAGLAGAVGEPAYQVWLDDWSVQQTAADTYRLRAAQDGWTLDLTLVDRKGPVLQGERGYSRKGAEPGNASYYYSQTRLETSGMLQAGGERLMVQGLSWMDHEFSTSALAKDQVGWDWFALQLNDGSELMLFTLRKADGSLDAFSSGTLIRPDGSTRALAQGDFAITAQRSWRSPRSGAEYPSGWEINIPAEEIRLTVEPYVNDQELNLSFTYWEGAVKLTGTRGGQSVRGSGYVEMTGYAHSMQGQF